MSLFILKNGKFITVDEKLFQLGDIPDFLFSEKIRAVRNKFPFFGETIDLLILKFRIFNQQIPEILALNGRELKRQMERLLVKNKLFKSAVVHVQFFKNEKQVDWVLSAEPMDAVEFELNKKGLLVDVFDKMPKAVSGLSNLSLGSETLWNIASAHLPDSGLDDYLICNTDAKIVEGIGAKLLIVKGNMLSDVASSAGAYMDAAGVVVPELAKRTGLLISEENGFTETQLYEADELILLDSVSGIRWVAGFRDKRYYSAKARLLNDALNRMLVRGT